MKTIVPKFEKITPAQIKALRSALGIGAMMIDLGNVDMDLGRAKDGDGHMMFTKTGHKISVGGYQYGLIASMSRAPCPEYLDYKGRALAPGEKVEI